MRRPKQTASTTSESPGATMELGTGGAQAKEGVKQRSRDEGEETISARHRERGLRIKVKRRRRTPLQVLALHRRWCCTCCPGPEPILDAERLDRVEALQEFCVNGCAGKPMETRLAHHGSSNSGVLAGRARAYCSCAFRSPSCSQSASAAHTAIPLLQPSARLRALFAHTCGLRVLSRRLVWRLVGWTGGLRAGA